MKIQLPKFKSQGLYTVKIRYWNASGSGFPPSLIPTLGNIGILQYKKAKLRKRLQQSVHSMWDYLSSTLATSLLFKTYFIPLWITGKYKLMIVNRAEVSRNKFTSAQVLRKKQKSKNKLVCRIQVRRRESYQTNFNGTLWQIILQILYSIQYTYITFS